MKKKFVALVVSMAVLLGIVVGPEVEAVARDGNIKEQVSLDTIGGGKIHLNAVKKASEKVVAVSLGDCHSGAVTEDGSLYMWGDNMSGQLGCGTNEFWSYRPVKILENVKLASLGGDHSGAVTKDGSLYMWGENFLGQLGNGTHEQKGKPVKVFQDVETVGLSDCTSGALTKNGSLYIWGGNFAYPAGADHTKPIKMFDNVESFSLGERHSGVVVKNGSLYMCGENTWGQLGNGTRSTADIMSDPVKVMDNVVSISLGENNSGAITKDGSLYMWGENIFGQLGDGTNMLRNRPVKVMDNVVSISLGEMHSGAITKDGSLYMWGENTFGQLGDGTNMNRNRPVKVLENVKAVSLGNTHSGAVTDDGSLYMWGDNSTGQLGIAIPGSYNKPVKINLSSNSKVSQKITYRSSAIKKGKVPYGTSFSLNAKTTGAGKLTYKSSNTKVFSVSSKGKVTVKGYGPATIQIKASGGNGYKADVRKFKLIAVPKRGKITKAVQENGIVRFKWKAEKAADGYEYATAYNKKFTGQSRKKTKKTGLVLTKYKTSTKKMFIKVRTYKKVEKKTYYGDWSKVRLLKLKKVQKSGESSFAIAN